MTEKASSREQIIRALPLVTEAVGVEIARRIAAGEAIAYAEGDRVFATRSATRDLAARRQDLMQEIAAKRLVKSEATSPA